MTDETNTVTLATELTVAWLSNPNTRADIDKVPEFLVAMHDALNNLSNPAPAAIPAPAEDYTPAVTAKKSLASADAIISMIDGKPYKTLRRHLSGHGLTPDQYRQRYGLRADYPMVAPAYSEARRLMAKQIGLGRKAVERVEAAAAPVAKTVRKGAKAALDAARGALGTSE